MLYSMVDYEDMQITYPITIRSYISAICTKLGLTFANASDTFVNYDEEIPSEMYIDQDGNSLGYTFRDVLDDLAEVTASTIVINDDDELEIRYINDTNDTINEEYLKDINVNFGEKYGAVNTVVLSRSAGSDKISQSIPENLPDEQKVAVVIEDNLIMNDNDRSRFIPAILTQLNGLEYYLNDFSSTGICYYDICDKYNVSIDGTTYSCIMFNDEINVTQGLEELVHTDIPEYGETDYKKTDKTDQKINQTNLIVDKQGRQITQVIQNQSETDSRLNETISTLDGTIQRVSATETTVNDITTTTQTSTGENSLYLEDAMQENIIGYNVDGATSQEGTPTPDSPKDVKTIPSIINLFDINSSYTTSQASASIQDNSIVVTNTGTYCRIMYKLENLIVGKTYIFHADYINENNSSIQLRITDSTNNTFKKYGDVTTSASGNTYVSFTATETTQWIRLYSNTLSSTNTNTVTFKNVMFEEGSILHEYVPYGYYFRVKITGKNLFKPFYFQKVHNDVTFTYNENGSINCNGTASSTALSMLSGESKPYLITLQPGTYTISGGTNQISIEIVDSSGTGLATTNYETSTSFTISSEKQVFVRLAMITGKTAQNDNIYPQLETGTTVTTYEPYKENITLVDMGIYENGELVGHHELCKIGDYKDTLSIDSNGNVSIDKKIGKVIYNGSESWFQASSQYTGLYTATIQRSDLLQTAPGNSIMSNYFNKQLYDSQTQGITKNSANYILIRIDNTIANSISTFKTWLSTHNTEIYYPLATPEVITLPNVQIPLYEGINHITFVDDLTTNTSVTYYRITPLSGTYATQKQLNDVSTEKTQEIIQVRNEVQTEITSTQASINVINETITNGVSKVSGTGYTFDSDGLKIEKTDQDVKSLLDNDGLSVSYKNTELLTVRSNGIEAENMTVRKFYVQRPIRMEKTKSISDSTSIGLGFFYVGE